MRDKRSQVEQNFGIQNLLQVISDAATMSLHKFFFFGLQKSFCKLNTSFEIENSVEVARCLGFSSMKFQEYENILMEKSWNITLEFPLTEY